MFCATAGSAPWTDRLSHRFLGVSLEATLRDLVEAHRRSRAPSDGVSVDPRVDADGPMLLADADEVLRSIGEPPFGPLFRAEVEAYLAITGTKAYLLGDLAVGDPSFVTRLRGGRSPYLHTVDCARAWMGEHSTAPERKAIAAASLHAQWWRLGVGVLPPQADRSRQGDRPQPRPTRYLTSREAARVLNVGTRWLRRRRALGRGPPYHVFGGQIRYAEADLHAWAERQRREPGGDSGE